MIIFAKNFRGFKYVELDTQKLLFLVGDNSSGKSSLLYLVDAVCKNDLVNAPALNEESGTDRYDYFSPYFSYADVTFGFVIKNKEGRNLAKIITVEKSAEHPLVSRCSYWFGGICVTIRRYRKTVQLRISAELTEFDTKKAISLHSNNSNFQKVEEFEPDTVSEISALLSVIDIKDDRLKPLVRELLGAEIKTCTLVSPLRAIPERFYSFSRRMDSKGTHFATMLMDIGNDSEKIFDLINKFGNESKLFDKLEVKKINDEIENPPLIVSINKNGKDFLMNQVGIGVSQIAPILIDSYFCQNYKENLLLVMQPELHLHPIAQAAFGSFLHAMALRGLNGIFETHSSFIIDRFRSELKQTDKADTSSIGAEIIFCTNEKNGNVAHHVPITPNGSISGEPNSYHQFFIDELVRTMF
jgi:predicted ATPase